MELNQTTLRGILAAVLSVDEKYVVPKQGNWFNPQEANANIANWCAYRIKSSRPRTVPYYVNLSGNEYVVAEKISEVELQFVGPLSESLAQSVALWPLRADVAAQFKTVNGSIMNDDMTAVSSVFAQDGNNTVLAWNVTFSVLWFTATAANQTAIRTIELGGQINVK